MDDAERDRLLLELVRQNHALLAKLEASGAGKVSTGKTLRQVYELDEAAWSGASWAPQMRGTLRPALRFLGDKVADQLTRADWQHWRDHIRAKETTKRKGLPTAYTLNHEVQRWRAVYRRQLEEGNVAANPLEGLKKVRGEKRHRETEPGADEARLLRPHCSPRLWAFVLLAFRRGLRAAEARRLEWKQVDLDGGQLRLHAWQEKTRRGGVLRITSDIVDALRAIRPDVPGRYVFQGLNGPLSSTTMWREFRLAVDAVGLEAAKGDGKVTYHDMRHGFVSAAARKLPLQVVMRLSRHASLSSAARYIHVNAKDLDGAHEVLEADDVRKPATRANTDSPGIYKAESSVSKPKP